MKKNISFTSDKEMICWLMDNEGVILHDYYGRRWKYFRFTFSFSDLGETYFTHDNICCLHLNQTRFYYLNI